MDDFANLEKTIVRELSCRLCLCTDVVKLKPLSAEAKRKIRKLFDIAVKADDSLPKAICHDCLQQITALHLYAVKVEKTQKFLEFHKIKSTEDRSLKTPELKMHPITANLSPPKIENNLPAKNSEPQTENKNLSTIKTEQQQGDVVVQNKSKPFTRQTHIKFMEALTMEEFSRTEEVDKKLLGTTSLTNPLLGKQKQEIKKEIKPIPKQVMSDALDPIVLIDGRPAKQGPDLDKQITLFYKMECCICHEKGFNFRSLMKHYKDRHGVPGYVACCNKKFHYFYPKKIIEHMAFHLQPNIFMCSSCHYNFSTSQDLAEHQSNGGRSEGKIICPRCAERYPTYRELGVHLVSHRTDKRICDYCGKTLKHLHRKKTVNHMEDVILCSSCIRSLRSIEKQEKETKEKVKVKNAEQKYHKFRQAMGLSSDDDGSSD